MMEFMQLYGTEAKAYRALYKARPDYPLVAAFDTRGSLRATT